VAQAGPAGASWACGRFRSRRREKSELSVPLPSEERARLCVNPL
jgi:hypothetical protein